MNAKDHCGQCLEDMRRCYTVKWNARSQTYALLIASLLPLHVTTKNFAVLMNSLMPMPIHSTMPTIIYQAGFNSNDRSKFQDFFKSFQRYKFPKIITYSSIVYALQTRTQQQKSTDIKLPVPITNAKTMLSFSTSHKLHHKKITSSLVYFPKITF